MTETRPTHIDRDTARRLSMLTLRAQQTVDGMLSGQHRSPHRGASVVFVEHRDYRPGDDPRTLDWRAFARTDRHVVKRFEQESQLRALLALDCSGSMAYQGDDGVAKADHAATLLAALASLLLRQGDATGVCTFADDVIEALPARTRPLQLERIFAALARPPVRGTTTRLARVIARLGEHLGGRGMVIIASDLLDDSPDAMDPITHLVARGNDVMVLHVMHPDEIDLPAGPHRFVGLEGEVSVEANGTEMQARYRDQVNAFLADRRESCLAAGARYAFAPTNVAAEEILAQAVRRTSRARWT